jgi:hypothetical protein
MNVTHINTVFNSKKQTMDFSYTIFPVKKTNVGEILKLWENHCLIIYSIHIRKFGNYRVWHWQRLHWVRGVSGGSLQNHWVPRLIHKPNAENRRQRHQAGLTDEEHRSDCCVMTLSGDFEVEDTCQDRKACVEAKQVCDRRASVRWCKDKDSQSDPRGCVS